MLVCVAGKNSIAINALKVILDKYCDISEVCVIPCSCDCGLDSWQPSLRKFAKDNNINIVNLEDIYKIPDLFFLSLEFDKIINIDKFDTRNLFNIHFSKLPKYKGTWTSIMPILNGECESGVTLHKIDSGIDTGAIISQITFDIDLNDTARDLYFKYLHYAFLLFCENIALIFSQNFKFTPQSFYGGSYYSRKSLDLNNIQILQNKTSFEIHNSLRAFIFKEYQLPKIHNIPIIKSILSDEFIGRNCFLESEDRFILSGIDGFKIEAYRDSAFSDS